MWRSLWLALVAISCLSASSALFSFQQPAPVAEAPAAVQAPQPSDRNLWVGRYAEFEEFLRTADIERTTIVSIGVLGIKRAFFKPGGMAASAALRNIRPGRYDGFWESYKSEIAAYKLDRLLQLDMVPPSVERRFEADPASVQIWISNTRMLGDTKKEGAGDPDARRWNRRLHRAQLFDNLTGNIDANAGNWLFDPAWNFIKIDCSRCFTDTATLPWDVKRIDRPFFERLKALDRATVTREIGNLLTVNGAMTALFRRRDSIVKAFEQLAKQNGEAQVFENWPER